MPILRVKTGCLTCRRRKKKCDEIRPLCTGCSRNKLSCLWPRSHHGIDGGGVDGIRVAPLVTATGTGIGTVTGTRQQPRQQYLPGLSPDANTQRADDEAQDLLFFHVPEAPSGSFVTASWAAQCIDQQPSAQMIGAGPMSPDSSSSAATATAAATSTSTSTAAVPAPFHDQGMHDFPDIAPEPFSPFPPPDAAAFDLSAVDFADAAAQVFPDVPTPTAAADDGPSQALQRHVRTPSSGGQPGVPRSMSLLPGMDSDSFELLGHYMSVTTRSMGNGSTVDNPFAVQLIPLAFGSDLILHLILTQSAVHRATRLVGASDSAASDHYRRSLRLFQQRLAQSSDGCAPELTTLAAAALILCFVEVRVPRTHHLHTCSCLPRY